MLERFSRGIAPVVITVALMFVFIARAGAAGQIVLDKRAIPIINKGVAFLEAEAKQRNSSIAAGRLLLAAYALLKVGRPVNHPIVVSAIEFILKDQDPEAEMYKPEFEEKGVYDAGLAIMLLAEVDPKKHLPTMEKIVKYFVDRQLPDGAWTYPKETVGDTSMTQYAILGLWAAQRSGVDVPIEVWNKAAQWHIKTQMGDGGFSYHPGTTHGPERGASTHNLTNAAGGSLLICRLNMYPALPMLGSNKKVKKKPKKFGVLEDVDPNAGKSEVQVARAAIKGLVSASQIENSAKRALGWMNARFVNETPSGHKSYFYYTIERFASLAGVQKISGNEWYPYYLGVLQRKQKPDGSWHTHSGPANGTSLALLFLARATGKILKPADLGGGLLAGGRGLPDDLENANSNGGKIKKRKIEGDLDKLLTNFEKLDLSALEDTQTAIVEKIQLGSKEELLGEMPRIRKLIEHPNGDIRRTAVWALGRSGDLRDAYLLIQRFEESDIGVLVETNNALCYLSRKLSGIGVPDDPFEGLKDNPTQAQQDAAMAAWRKDAIEKWTRWYLRVRPYNDRNDLFQLKFGGAVKKK
jgi:hypothetical protein